jgi:hypothetical protein
MPVLLDNIRIYHGPSWPEKPRYFAFNSNQKGSKGSKSFLSGEQAALY